jgi:hypothetical protein
MAAENYGKHKVPTLRNVDKRPGRMFPKAYMHNGVFKSLEEVVHFYNTRDVEDWPPPEVYENVNTDELGDLGLTLEEEHLIVVFMRTLSDGYEAKSEPMEQLATGTMPIELAGANPAGPSSAIAFSLPEAGRVEVALFDVNGRKVATLLDGWRDAGTQVIDIDAAGLSSGVYFIHLANRGEVSTKKLVFLR